MTTPSYYQQIRQLIGNDDLKMAIQELSNLLKNSPQLNEVIMQSARLRDVKKQVRQGVLSYDEASLAKNQIRAGLLELVDEMQESTATPAINAEVDRYVTQMSGKNIVTGTITAGGSVSIGDQIQHVTESKTSRNVRVFLLVFVPLLAIVTGILYYRYQQMQQPLMLSVSLDNQTPNAELDRDFKGGTLVLQYGAKSDTQIINNESTFKGIPANYRGEAVSLRFSASGFHTIDTTFSLSQDQAIALPINRDDTYAQLTGMVTSEDGNPIPGALVSTQSIDTLTDSQGRFTLAIPFEKQRRKQRLSVTKDGYKAWDRTEPVFKNELIRIQLENGRQ